LQTPGLSIFTESAIGGVGCRLVGARLLLKDLSSRWGRGGSRCLQTTQASAASSCGVDRLGCGISGEGHGDLLCGSGVGCHVGWGRDLLDAFRRDIDHLRDGGCLGCLCRVGHAVGAVPTAPCLGSLGATEGRRIGDAA